MTHRWLLALWVVGVLVACFETDAVAATGEVNPATATAGAKLTAAQLFALADMALRSGNTDTAATAYRALANDPDRAIRNEARFRLAIIYMNLGRYSDAEPLYRKILGEEPEATRIHLELARALDLRGDNGGAIRELRKARAMGLPPEVARRVEAYAAALSTREPFGFSYNIAVAPDSNINRATRADSLDTVIGEFELDEDARERSGVGLALSAATHARARISERMNLLGRMFTKADLYPKRQFNDISLSVSAGPEFRIRDHFLNLEIGRMWREFGGEPYSEVSTLTLTAMHPFDRENRLRTSATLGLIDNKRNARQDGHSYSFGLGYEHDLSFFSSVGVSLFQERQDLRHPGYSTTFDQVSLYGHYEFSLAKVFGSISYGYLEADERLAIYPQKRAEELYQATIAVFLPRFEIAGFLPQLRLQATRNQSDIELYSYSRTRMEFSFGRAF